MGVTLEHDGASVVLLGSFNPAIFQPAWIGAQGLIRPEEAKNAEIRTIQPEIADFATEWFQLQVLQNRLQIVSADPRHYSALRDLCSGLFAILPHTPISKIGLNRNFHYSMQSQDTWHALGHRLAPKQHWNNHLRDPGLRSMVMEGRRKDIDAGLVKIKVEPSTTMKPGILVEINVEFSSPAEIHEAQWVRACLDENWNPVMDFAETTALDIVRLV